MSGKTGGRVQGHVGWDRGRCSRPVKDVYVCGAVTIHRADGVGEVASPVWRGSLTVAGPQVEGHSQALESWQGGSQVTMMPPPHSPAHQAHPEPGVQGAQWWRPRGMEKGEGGQWMGEAGRRYPARRVWQPLGNKSRHGDMPCARDITGKDVLPCRVLLFPLLGVNPFNKRGHTWGGERNLAALNLSKSCLW